MPAEGSNTMEKEMTDAERQELNKKMAEWYGIG
jgi:hypothetical protein